MDDFEGFARILELDVDDLRTMVFSANNYYRDYKIPKRSGGFRQLKVPIESLKNTHRIILRKILNVYEPYDCVHAYCRGRSIVTNATVHINSNTLLKLDLEDFFGNIKFKKVYEAFEWIRLFGGGIDDNGTLVEYKAPYTRWLTLLCCYQGALPQGAPTSPILSNIAARDLDVKLSKHSKEIGIVYTRYSDDMTFSSSTHISKKERRTIIKLIEQQGYIINKEKMSYVPTGKDKFITGIYLTDGQLRLPKIRRREIRSEIFNYEKVRSKDILTLDDLRRARAKVLGKINYWLTIEPTAKYPLVAKNRVANYYPSRSTTESPRIKLRKVNDTKSSLKTAINKHAQDIQKMTLIDPNAWIVNSQKNQLLNKNTKELLSTASGLGFSVTDEYYILRNRLVPTKLRIADVTVDDELIASLTGATHR